MDQRRVVLDQLHQQQQKLDRINARFSQLESELEDLEGRIPDPKEFAQNRDLQQSHPK